jgi:hypothetical protein
MELCSLFSHSVTDARQLVAVVWRLWPSPCHSCLQHVVCNKLNSPCFPVNDPLLHDMQGGLAAGGGGGASGDSGAAAGMGNPALLASLLSGLGGQGAAGGGAGGAAGMGGLEGIMQLMNTMGMGGMGGMGGFGAPPPVADPATTYATQIQQLQVRPCACRSGSAWPWP